MTVESPSTRRDRRFALSPGSSTAKIGSELAAIGSVSVCGFTCEFGGRPEALEVDSYFSDVVVHVGECVIRGDIVVRNVRTEDDHTVVGCMFYPNTSEAEERWMTLLAGVQAAQAVDA